MLWLRELRHPLLPEHIKMNFVSASHAVTLPGSIFVSKPVRPGLREWWKKVKQVLAALNRRPVTESACLYHTPPPASPGRDYEKKQYEIEFNAMIAGLRII